MEFEQVFTPKYEPGQRASAFGRRASTYTPGKMPHLWDGWLDLDAVTVVVGAPESQKSTFVRDLITRISRDLAMPTGTLGKPGGIVYYPAEEPIDSWVVPELIRMGANMDKIVILDKVQPPDQPERRVQVPDDIDNGNMEMAVREVGACLIVIDTIRRASSINLWANAPAAKLMDKFQQFAQRMGVAILLIHHPKRGGNPEKLDDAGDAMAIIQAARKVWAIRKVDGKPGRSVLTQVKNNQGIKPAPIFFERDKKTGMLVYTGGVLPEVHKAVETKQTRDAKADILAFINGHPGLGYTDTALCQILTIESRATAEAIADQLVKENKIHKTNRGIYISLSPVQREK